MSYITFDIKINNKQFLYSLRRIAIPFLDKKNPIQLSGILRFAKLFHLTLTRKQETFLIWFADEKLELKEGEVTCPKSSGFLVKATGLGLRFPGSSPTALPPLQAISWTTSWVILKWYASNLFTSCLVLQNFKSQSCGLLGTNISKELMQHQVFWLTVPVSKENILSFLC